MLAARSPEDPGTSVLLLEAGPDHTSAGAPAGLHSPNFFDAMMEPGRIWPNLVATRAAEQPETLYVRGFGAGGSSSVNAMGALRGTVDDYERWAGELGCAGWGWPEMLATFLRVEDDADYGGEPSIRGCPPSPMQCSTRRADCDRCSCAPRSLTSAFRPATTTTVAAQPASAGGP